MGMEDIRERWGRNSCARHTHIPFSREHVCSIHFPLTILAIDGFSSKRFHPTNIACRPSYMQCIWVSTTQGNSSINSANRYMHSVYSQNNSMQCKLILCVLAAILWPCTMQVPLERCKLKLTSSGCISNYRQYQCLLLWIIIEYFDRTQHCNAIHRKWQIMFDDESSIIETIIFIRKWHLNDNERTLARCIHQPILQRRYLRTFYILLSSLFVLMDYLFKMSIGQQTMAIE